MKRDALKAALLVVVEPDYAPEYENNQFAALVDMLKKLIESTRDQYSSMKSLQTTLKLNDQELNRIFSRPEAEG